MTTPLAHFPWKSTRLQFRKFREEDRTRYYSIATSDRVMKYISGAALSTEQADRRYREILQINQQHPNYGFYALTNEAGQFIGLGKLEPKDNGEIELGYALLPDYWGHGLGTEISLFLTQQALTIDPDVQLMAYIDPENSASQKILEKSGFQFSESGSYQGRPSAIYRKKSRQKQ